MSLVSLFFYLFIIENTNHIVSQQRRYKHFVRSVKSASLDSMEHLVRHVEVLSEAHDKEMVELLPKFNKFRRFVASDIPGLLVPPKRPDILPKRLRDKLKHKISYQY